MNKVPGIPGSHQGADTTRSIGWRAQQYFNAADYETTLPATFPWDVGVQQVRFVTLGQSSTVTFPTNIQRGGTYILFLKQDATGSRTMTWTAQLAGLGSGAWKWSGGTAPTLTTTAGKVDIVTFISDGVNMYGTSVLNF